METQTLDSTPWIIQVIQKLSLSRTIDDVVEIVKKAARQLTGADGATFILRDGNSCYYVDEDAIGPLWKGSRFPFQSCVSGWAMSTGQCAIIDDIYKDSRIPIDLYKATFVKSLVVVPIRQKNPIGAIGTYWASYHSSTPEEVRLLQALADSTSIALENVHLFEELNRSLQQTQTARDELEKQLNLRDEFISLVAHELKTPITPLMVQMQLIERKTKSDRFSVHPLQEELDRLLALSTRKLSDLANLIESLLDISRIRLGNYIFNFENEVDVSQLVLSIVEEFRLTYTSEMNLKLAPHAIGECNSSKMRQVIRSLVANAVKFGRGNPIDIEVIAESKVIKIIIQDQGIGISDIDQARIFLKFERATTLHSYGGLGLGLYLSKKIIEAHRGAIRVESEVGKGSKFIVELPNKG